MATTRTHVVLPEELLKGIDALVGKRGRSAFLAEVAAREVKRRNLMALLSDPEPAWKSEDHPELKHGAAAWVSNMRKADDKHRMKKARYPR
jgi:Arc/MetJ-type ribon-helix-helix transcriptional regulator